MASTLDAIAGGASGGVPHGMRLALRGAVAAVGFEVARLAAAHDASIREYSRAWLPTVIRAEVRNLPTLLPKGEQFAAALTGSLVFGSQGAMSLVSRVVHLAHLDGELRLLASVNGACNNRQIDSNQSVTAPDGYRHRGAL